MVSVNPGSLKKSAAVGPGATHAAMLMGRLLRTVRASLADEDWDGLRQSHLRLLSEVPPDGSTITDLGERLGMTKQASGQFVRQLVSTGHLRVTGDSADRRSRIVLRTRLGDRTHVAATERVRQVESQWAERVGVRRYAQFRAVLDDLAAPE